MPNLGKIKIEHFIVHILDNQRGKSTFSNSEIVISSTIQEFLIKYIKFTLENTKTRAARFNKPANTIENMCNMMLQDPEHNFVVQSQEIAKNLFAIMKRDTKISKGDLLVCIYSTDRSNFPVAAIFKIDLTTAYFHDIIKKGGIISIDIRPRGDAYPLASELQKCVVIFPTEPKKTRKDYDLIILDNQIGSIAERASSDNFFCKTFLNCRLVLNDRDRTILFRKNTEKWLKREEKRGKITDTEYDTIRDLSTHNLQLKSINVPKFAEFAIKSDELRQDYLNYIRKKGLFDAEFKPDASEVQKIIEKRRFKGDNNLYLEVDRENFDKMIEIGERGPDNMRTIKIKTTNWREVDHK